MPHAPIHRAAKTARLPPPTLLPPTGESRGLLRTLSTDPPDARAPTLPLSPPHSLRRLAIPRLHRPSRSPGTSALRNCLPLQPTASNSSCSAIPQPAADRNTPPLPSPPSAGSP